MGLCPLPHIAIFPFMSKGHTIPLLHLAHLISRRRLATLTFFTTPLNADFLRRSLTGTCASVVELQFPHDAPGIPPGVESTDRLPSMSHFIHFVRAAKQLQPHFDTALRNLLPPVSLLISDGFLGWSNGSASKLGIPRMVFYGMGNFSMAVLNVATRDGLAVDSDEHQLFPVPRFPGVYVSRAELGIPLDDGSDGEFIKEHLNATRESRGIVVNSFYEMESEYNECWNSEFVPRAWCVGPLCLARPEAAAAAPAAARPPWMEWLDLRLEMKRPVLYVAFGSQAEVSRLQMEEFARGLDGSGVDFLWVVRGAAAEEEVVVVGERGMVVREWVDQAEILAHESVVGFMSHCGWNSVMEAVAAGVPILAHPMMAEQFVNAVLVVEVMGIGLRVRRARDHGMVRREEVEEMVRELMLGEKGKEAAGKVRELAGAARKAVDDGGSSWRTLEEMIDAVCNCKEEEVDPPLVEPNSVAGDIGGSHVESRSFKW